MAAAGLIQPTTAFASAGRAPSFWRAWLATYAAIWAFTLAAAVLAHVMPGGPALARHLLALKLTAAHNPPPSLGLVFSIALNNTFRSIWPLTLGILGAHRHRLGRTLADAAVTANLLVPGLLVGAAVAGYGTQVLPYLQHVPVEWSGIAAGVTGWRIERTRRQASSERVAAVSLATASLGIAAFVEVFLSPHR